MEKGPGATFLMNDHALPFYARAIAILYSELNGRAELRSLRQTTFSGLSSSLCQTSVPKITLGVYVGQTAPPWRKAGVQLSPMSLLIARAVAPTSTSASETRAKSLCCGRLILTERDNLTNSAPPAALIRLGALAVELKDMEGRR